MRRLPAFAGQLGVLSQSLQMLMWRGHVHPLREDAGANTEQAGKLSRWIERQGLAVQVVAECGTAVHVP
ncbi:hypothetical protein [Pseudomonas sp. FME51]|uniref:hypothetical protein n=1 Tax=Pseudomonas sp. FME51 TaxID=2742609 RepID=UPI001868E2F6|nr:hypothetical protein [Pseudomonas sp. FME51]